MRYLVLITFIGMTLIACSSKKNQENISDTNKIEEVNLFEEVLHTDRVFIHLKGGVSPGSIEKAFSEYGLKTMKQVSRSQALYHFSYSEKSIELDKLVEKLKAHEDIIDASTISYTTKKKK